MVLKKFGPPKNLKRTKEGLTFELEPFELTPNDPKAKKRNEGEHTKAIIKHFNRGNTKKHLTKSKFSYIMDHVNKLKRKDNKMAQDKNKKSNKRNGAYSVAWLIFAVQQAFSGLVLLRTFDNLFVVASAYISLGIAGVVVVSHFLKAHK